MAAGEGNIINLGPLHGAIGGAHPNKLGDVSHNGPVVGAKGMVLEATL